MNYMKYILENQVIKPIMTAIDSKKYIFSIHGISLYPQNEIVVGKVTFITKEKLKEMLNDQCKYFKYEVDTYALVDLTDFKFKKHYNYGLNSVALKVLKETIGYLNIGTFLYKPKDVERKITISNIDKHIMDEGLLIYLCEKDGVFREENKIFSSVGLTMSSNEILEIKKMNSNWEKLLSTEFENRNELQKKILKGLEYLYYISNEVYASERMIKYFIVLNCIIRNGDEDLNVMGIKRLLNIVFAKVEVNNEHKNLVNKQFEDIFNRTRNDILHGILDLDNEESLIDVSDYHPLKSVTINLIIALVENEQLNSLSTTQELYDLVGDIIKNLKNNKK